MKWGALKDNRNNCELSDHPRLPLEINVMQMTLIALIIADLFLLSYNHKFPAMNPSIQHQLINV